MWSEASGVCLVVSGSLQLSNSHQFLVSLSLRACLTPMPAELITQTSLGDQASVLRKQFAIN
jgi:hypothetical protein